MDEFDKMRLEISDIANNPTTRLPLMLCIDASFSMVRGGRNQKINDGIRYLLKELQNDIYAVDSVELCIVSFGGNGARIECSFGKVKDIHFVDIVPNGETPLGGAVTFALDQLDERLNLLNELGVNNYKPWIVIISDGEATDEYEDSANRCKKLEREGKLKVFPIHIGNEKSSLKEFSNTRQVYELDDFKVSHFFSWLSQSMSAQSKSTGATDEMIEMNFLVR